MAATNNFNLRGISPETMATLKQEAEKEHTSVNSLILNLIENSMGLIHEVKRHQYHDLDKLAGTWSIKDANEFEKNIKDFEKIDKDIWS